MSEYERIYRRGVMLDRRTWSMILELERRTGLRLVLSQGSYKNPPKGADGGSNVGASGSTHDYGGAVDIADANLYEDERKLVVREGKDIGFAIWFRPTVPKLWGSHVHALDAGNKLLSPGARRQVEAFDAGRDGLTGNRVDRTYRPSPKVKWDFAKQKPVRR